MDWLLWRLRRSRLRKGRKEDLTINMMKMRKRDQSTTMKESLVFWENIAQMNQPPHPVIMWVSQCPWSLSYDSTPPTQQDGSTVHQDTPPTQQDILDTTQIPSTRQRRGRRNISQVCGDLPTPISHCDSCHKHCTSLCLSLSLSGSEEPGEQVWTDSTPDLQWSGQTSQVSRQERPVRGQRWRVRG